MLKELDRILTEKGQPHRMEGGVLRWPYNAPRITVWKGKDGSLTLVQPSGGIVRGLTAAGADAEIDRWRYHYKDPSEHQMTHAGYRALMRNAGAR